MTGRRRRFVSGRAWARPDMLQTARQGVTGTWLMLPVWVRSSPTIVL